MSSGSSSGDVSNISLVFLQNEIKNMNEKIIEIITSNRNLKKHVDVLTCENDNLFDLICDAEIQRNNLDQYSHRNNIEIRYIPEEVNKRNIEHYVLKLMESIGVKLQSYDLVAVHRIGKFQQGIPRNVIIRFINRKYAFTCLRNSKKVVASNNPEYKKLFILENLCPANKNIFNYLYKLKKKRIKLDMCGHIMGRYILKNLTGMMTSVKR